MKNVLVLFLALVMFSCQTVDESSNIVAYDKLEKSGVPEVSAAETCLKNTISLQSLTAPCGAIPANLSGLLSGVNYIAASDPAQGAYATHLYPGSNTMPATHRAKGDSISNVLRAGGAIKVICYGMSSSKLMFDNMIVRMGSSTLDNASVTVIDKAESGCDLLNCWLPKGSLPFDADVDVVLIYHSNNKPQSTACVDAKRFPTHALATQSNLETFLGYVKTAHPNAKQIFIGSREFGGWSNPPSNTKNLEPVAFEEGFSVKWLVESHLNQTNPWIGWGPYTWDKNTPRSYFRNDGAHPCSSTGVPFFGEQWFNFMLNDQTAKIWFAANPISN